MPDIDALISLSMREAGIGVLSWDVARDSMKITEPVYVLHGLSFPAELNYRAWLMTVHADDQESVHQVIQRALKEKCNCQNEYRVTHPDGSKHWVSIQGRGYSDRAGKSLRFIGILFDVTAKKRAEQVLKEQHQVLAHMARVSTLGELSAALAHELNQPLTAMLCNAQAGQRFMAQASPDLEELHTILSDIAVDNQRAGAVVSRLRGLFRKEEAIQEVLDINTLIEDVTQLLRSELVSKQVFLLLHLSADLPGVMGDSVQLRQVLLNLIMNGIQAMTTSVSGSRQLQIRTDLHDVDSLEVTVRDTGPGIDPQMLDDVFKSFVTGRPHGLGLGLSISRSIIAAHGGRLWADNALEGGAILRFTLPIFQGPDP